MSTAWRHGESAPGAAALFVMAVDDPWVTAAAATASLLAALDALPHDYRRYVAFTIATLILALGAGQDVIGIRRSAPS